MPLALTMSDDIAFMIVVSGPGVSGIDGSYQHAHVDARGSGFLC
jgi:hypothetical protein